MEKKGKIKPADLFDISKFKHYGAALFPVGKLQPGDPPEWVKEKYAQIL